MQVTDLNTPSNPAVLTVQGKTITSLFQLQTTTTPDYVVVATDNQGNASWGQVTTTSILNQTIVKEDLAYYEGIQSFVADASHRGSPFHFLDTYMNDAQLRQEDMGPALTFAPGTYLFTFHCQIAFDRQGDFVHYPGAWIRLYNTTKSEHYCAIHAISTDDTYEGEDAGTTIHEFTETTTIVARISVQEGNAVVWNSDGLVARAIRLF